MPVSFQIAMMATFIAILIAIPLGTISALYRDTWIDHSVRVLAVSGLAIPSFWLGMLIILALLSLFNWLPKIGYVLALRGPDHQSVGADLAGRSRSATAMPRSPPA